MNSNLAPSATASDYVELAKLSHEAFNGRRQYEWRVNFGLWTALGAVTYFSVTNKIQVFETPFRAYLAGAFLLGLYLNFQVMISIANHKDKKWKHIYQTKVDGFTRTDTPIIRCVLSVLWLVSQFGFTVCLIYLVIRLLLGVKGT